MAAQNVLYTGLATWGRLRAAIGFIVALLCGGLFVALGSILLISGDPHSVKADARVTSISCEDGNCQGIVSFYDQAGVLVNAAASLSPKNSRGDIIEVHYNPNQPEDVVESVSGKKTAILFLVIGLPSIIVSGLTMYFSFKSKTFAAVEGGLNIADRLF